MSAPVESDFSVRCLCGGAPEAWCHPGEVTYKGPSNGAPQKRQCGVCKGAGFIHRDHGERSERVHANHGED